MSKINKVYPAFFNGVSQQSPELVLDNQCKEMVNCIPDIVKGITKRPPLKYVTSRRFDQYPEMENASVFHTYDRGEDDEEYIMVNVDDADDPVQVFNKAGEQQTVVYNATHAADIKSYLSGGNLKGLTVQDRTWVFSKNQKVALDYEQTAPLKDTYNYEAFYWLKRGSGDRYNPFNYAVYLNGNLFECNPDKPSGATEDPATGFEDSDYAANYLSNLINGYVSRTLSFEVDIPAETQQTFEFNVGKTNPLAASNPITLTPHPKFPGFTIVDLVDYSYNQDTGILSITILNNSYSVFNELTPINMEVTIEITFDSDQSFTSEVRGSVLKIFKKQGGDFEFSSWDSWGNQASQSWKGSVNKLSDLPKDMPFNNVFVKILGQEGQESTNYYVKWNGSSWEECLDPEADRGKLSNMPVKMDRTGLVNGVATFTFDLIDWSEPRVGNIDNNPDPSFVDRTIQDLFFYKNRLGIASEDSVSLTESANYTNFYGTTAIDIVDTDVIDITVSTNQASKIYYAKPFNNSLYIFTKYAQYELVSEGVFSPSTVSLNNTTNYPMAIDVEPVVINDRLLFISTTNNRQQLREYIKTDNLNVTGVDLNVSTPTYMAKPIKKIIADGVLGYVLCCTDTGTVYFYSFKEDGTQRIQSAWSRWELIEYQQEYYSDFEYNVLGSDVIVTFKGSGDYKYQTLPLVPSDSIVYRDEIGFISVGPPQATVKQLIQYKSSILLPDYYPQLGTVRTPLNKMLIKRVKVEGEGAFNGDVYRKDYNKTYTKSKDYSMKDLDLNVASKVGNVDITIYDDSTDNFKLTSVVVEGLFNTTSREMR
jgi:hypothetical protein